MEEKRSRLEHISAQRESHIERRAAARVLEELGVFSVKLSRTQEAGYPDRLFILPGGRAVWCEVKKPGGKRTARQVLIHERLRHFGHEVHTLDTADEIVEVVRAALARG